MIALTIVSAPLAECLTDLLPKQERQAINLLADFDVSDGVNIFSAFACGRNTRVATNKPIFDGYLVLFPGPTFTSANIEATAAGNPLLISRDNWDIGVRVDDTKRETLRTVFGVRGGIGKVFEFEVSDTYGESGVQTKF
jgi:iron complex outermembrane receptor protein